MCLFIALIGIYCSALAENQYLSAVPDNGVQTQTAVAYIALIIDDLGYRAKNDKRAILLEGKIAYAFLPDTPYVKSMAELARQNNKEVILHLPMQSEQEVTQEPNVLKMDMDKKEFIQLVEKNLSLIPFAGGINNHMGSLLTQSKKHMHWLMAYLAARSPANQFFFIDSRTSKKTIAEKVAHAYQIPTSRRNVFLDNDRTPEAIEKQYKQLIKLAKKFGSALAIAHPFNSTLSFLEEKLPELKQKGIQLVSIKELINIQGNCSTLPCKLPLIAKKNYLN